ncbi:PfkB family carbohydrate kinase, partial [Ruminococcaceae bacterium OttesenSCG-928-N02]|nr:PfkB family carbohydrate kinase [Ruminococcaceae bacterium OttesenSCG-928-N02]
TTAAGDTFTGYFLAAILAGKSPAQAMNLAAKAAAICVTRAGAAPSIPTLNEVEKAVF